MRTRIKICGITRKADAEQAIDCGVDAIGLVFYSGSRRAVTLDQAMNLVQDWPGFVCRVGLWVNPTVKEVQTVLQQNCVDLLQFHGEETEDFCQQFARPYIKALHITASTTAQQLLQYIQAYPSAQGLLLDTQLSSAEKGGTGHCFDWSLWPQSCSQRLILAGGLNPANVGSAIRQLRPYAVDVSSGVEQPEQPGIKDRSLMQDFIQAVFSTSTELN